MQHCLRPLAYTWAELHFQRYHNGPNDPKGNVYNLHCGKAWYLEHRRLWTWILISNCDIRYLPNIVLNFDLRLDLRCVPNTVLNFYLGTRYSSSIKCGAEFRSQNLIIDIYRLWRWISISELDSRCILNMVLNIDKFWLGISLYIDICALYSTVPYDSVRGGWITWPESADVHTETLNFDLGAWYSVLTKYGAEFRSQNSILSICRIWCWISISELDIRCIPNMELDFDLRPWHSVSTAYGAEFRSQTLVSRRMWSWIPISELNSRRLPKYGAEFRSQLEIPCVSNMMLDIRYTDKCWAEFQSQNATFGISRIWCWISTSELDIWCPDECGAGFRSQSYIFGAYQNMALNFDFRARNSVCIEYDANFRPQRSTFGTQTNVELNSSLRTRYLIFRIRC